ncbi:glucans biosynthesis glucosyltransferase MdoH [Geminicoccaceae bacterium 1502E]|nr:glucans biosynthesis glucosyltransferase MdoH [Geminicoccaceae bacterium 1502E]
MAVSTREGGEPVLGRVARCWAAAQGRARAYLVAAGLEPSAATDNAAALTGRAAERGEPETREEAARRVLQDARRMLTLDPAALEARDGRLTPHQIPSSIRRQSLLPALRWRRGRWLPRPVLIPREHEERRIRASARPADVRPGPTARRRRSAFLVLILLTTVWTVLTFAQILASNGLSALDLAHIAIFSLLALWLAQSFWTLSAGFVVMLQRWWKGTAPTALPDPGEAAGRVAIVMPIYNEGTERVFAGLKAMWQDLRRTAPEDRRCDLVILSDTTDPDVWLAEVEAWRQLRQEVGDVDRVFYRRRDRNIARKTGNIEDFLTRFGANYAYMLVLDADSLMTARAMLELVRRMDENPRVGLIQAPPKLVRGRTLFARVLQAAGELYGPLAAAGIGFWARGEGNYWGHNAIIRVRPFIELCGLPNLPGRAPFGGPILSHDFVEAALMRRGGWQVWIADDLDGSYEEPPPTIEDFGTRDRRWCQGNLQHGRVLFARHLHWVSRLHLAIGIMAYVTSPLWLIFLVLSALQAWELTHTQPLYFAEGWPFPVFPVSVSFEATLLLLATLGMLFVPKFLGLAVALLDAPRRRRLGGTARVVGSMLIETLYSALVAPVMMLMHTWFVLTILMGGAIEWKPQRRDAASGDVAAAVASFFWPTVIGIAAAFGVWHATPLLFLWLVPVLAGLILAVPLALLGASEKAGQRLAAAGLLRISEEAMPPAVMWELAGMRPAGTGPSTLERLVRAVMEPQANALHLQLLRAFRTSPPLPPAERRLLERKAIYLGPALLEKAERRALLEDTEMLERLHLEAWLHWPDSEPRLVAALGPGVEAALADPQSGPVTAVA